MNQESPLFTKAFDLQVYVFQVSAKFPRHQRPILGRRLQEISLRLFDLLLSSRKCSDEERGTLLAQADVELDRLRYTLRLCHELEILGRKQYLHASALCAETGKLLGAWRKRYNLN